MDTAHGKSLGPSLVLCALLSALFWPRAARPALPPGSSGPEQTGVAPAKTSGGGAPVPSTASAPAAERGGWYLPPIKIGGTVSYDVRSNGGEGGKMVQHGLISTVRIASETHIWEPWFARLGGSLNLSASQSNNSVDHESGGFSSTFKTMTVEGDATLRILPQSAFPFQAHWSRRDNRISSELLTTGNFVSERVGFEQRYSYAQGDASLAWERNSQQSEEAGKTQQDMLQIRLSHSLSNQRINGSVSLARNKQVNTGERTAQDNITIQHSYTPGVSTSLESMVNATQFDSRLATSQIDSRLFQASSIVFWRPEDYPLTLTGGVRVLGMAANDRRDPESSRADSGVRNANLNLGMNYELNRQTHVTAAVNTNFIEGNGRSAMASNESLALTYQADSTKFVGFDYSWLAGTSAGHNSGQETSGTQLTLQLSHRLSRGFVLSEGSGINVELSQSITGNSATGFQEVNTDATRHLSHGGSVSWNKATEGTNSIVRLSFNDTRALNGKQEFFQMINLQASSNVPTGRHSSWTGSLTLQGTRQGGIDYRGTGSGTGSMPENRGGFVTTSTGTLSYQNQRAFGQRGLRFMSDLRLSSEALIPLLSGPQDRELAAWENRLDYSIGRLQLRMSTLVSHSSAPTFQGYGEARVVNKRQSRYNRAIMFSATRSFGDF